MKRVLLYVTFLTSILAAYAFVVPLPPNYDAELDIHLVDLNSHAASYSTYSASIAPITIQVTCNPVELRVDFLANQMVNMRVEDANGAVVYSNMFDSSKKKKLVLDTSGWLRGSYRIVFKDQAGNDYLQGFFNLD